MGVDKNSLAPSPFLRMFMYIIFKPILARQDQVRIVIELKRFFNVKIGIKDQMREGLDFPLTRISR